MGAPPAEEELPANRTRRVPPTRLPSLHVPPLQSPLLPARPTAPELAAPSHAQESGLFSEAGSSYLMASRHGHSGTSRLDDSYQATRSPWQRLESPAVRAAFCSCSKGHSQSP